MAFIRASKGGGGGMGEPELLWTNPNPSATFAAQTISLNLSPYKAVGIKISDTGDVLHIYLNNGQFIDGYFTAGCGAVATNPSLLIRVRVIQNITNSGVVFGDAYSVNQKYNQRMIPTHIYGIR